MDSKGKRLLKISLVWALDMEISIELGQACKVSSVGKWVQGWKHFWTLETGTWRLEDPSLDMAVILYFGCNLNFRKIENGWRSYVYSGGYSNVYRLPPSMLYIFKNRATLFSDESYIRLPLNNWSQVHETFKASLRVKPFNITGEN